MKIVESDVLAEPKLRVGDLPIGQVFQFCSPALKEKHGVCVVVERHNVPRRLTGAERRRRGLRGFDEADNYIIPNPTRMFISLKNSAVLRTGSVIGEPVQLLNSVLEVSEARL